MSVEKITADRIRRENLADYERDAWNAAIDAAIAVCEDVQLAAVGQGHRMPGRRAKAGGNPHSHLSAELQLGAARCLTGIAGLRR